MEFSDSSKNYNCARPRPSIYIFETPCVIPVFCYQTIGVLDLHFNYLKSDKKINDKIWSNRLPNL